MRLTRLELHDFSVYADVDIDFSPYRSVAIVGDNGIGKSTLLQAIVWCLTGRPVRGGIDSLLRDGTAHAWVRTTWQRDGHEYVIQRNRSTETKAGESALTYSIDGERHARHTIAESQAALTAEVGLTRDQLLAAPLMAQGDSAILMDMRPGDRSSLIASVFDLERMVPWHERAKEWQTSAERELAVLDDRRVRWEERVAEEPIHRQALIEAQASLEHATGVLATAESDVAELRKRAEALRADAARADELGKRIVQMEHASATADERSTSLAERLEQSHAVLAQPIPDEPVEPVSTSLAALEAEVEQWTEASRRKAALIAELPHAKAALEQGRVHLSRVEHLCDICPYRGEMPDMGALEDAVTSIEGRITGQTAVMDEFASASGQLSEARALRAAYDADVANRATLIERRQSIERLAADLTERLKEARATAAKLWSDILEAKAEQARLAESATAAADVDEDMRVASVRIEAAVRGRDEHLRRVGALEDVLAGIARAKEEIASLDASQRSLRERASGLYVVARMFHRTGLPTMILEQGLPAIEDTANSLLARLPGDIALRFLTQRQTKGGTWTDDFDIEVDEAGRTRPYEVMSGAERFRIDLALRVAIENVLSHRTGRGFDTLWLDEPFDWQDRHAIEPMLQAVGALASDLGLVVIVTHQPEVADRIPGKLEIVPQGTHSEVRVA